MSFKLIGQKSRQGFTLVELLVVIAIVIILLALLIPVINNSIATRKQAECVSNLKQIGTAIEVARIDNEVIRSKSIDGKDLWTSQVLPRLNDDANLLYCSEDYERVNESSYGMNKRSYRFSDMDGSRIVALDYDTTEADIVVNDISEQDVWTEEAESYAARHLQGVNALLHAGGVKSFNPEEIDPRVCALWKQYWRPHHDHEYQLTGCDGTGSSTSNSNSGPPQPRNPPPQVHKAPTGELDPENYCEYQDEFHDLDDDQGSSGDATFQTVYDNAPNNPNSQEIVTSFEMFGQTFEFIEYAPLHFKSKTHAASSGSKHTEAWGHQDETTKAVYEFNGLEPGRYNVYTIWAAHPNNSDNTPHSVYDGTLASGGPQVYSERIDQKTTPSASDKAVKFDINGSSRFYYQIGDGHQIDSGTLRLEITADTGAMHPNDDTAAQEAEAARKKALEENPDADLPVVPYQASLSLAIADAVRVACTTDPAYVPGQCLKDEPQTIDNGGSGYSQEGDWTEIPDEGSHEGDNAQAGYGGGDATATYAFPESVAGLYRVWLRWKPAAGLATDMPVSVYEGDRLLRTFSVDLTQEYIGADLDGERWYSAGEVEIRNGKITVVMSNAASNGIVVADAVRVQCGYGGQSSCDNDVYGRQCRRYYEQEDGMTEETEQAVERSFGWLSKHQLPGGLWSFDHQQGTGEYILDPPQRCGDQCGGPGQLPAFRVAATGFALLPFLGAGMGPTHPVYGDVVTEGVKYLLEEAGASTNNGTLASGEDAWVWHNGVVHMQGYEQGIAGLALIEALGVCRQSGFGEIDEAVLTQAATAVTARIVRCQSQGHGGWRYSCAGDQDSTVTSWNYQALYAAAAIGIDVQGMSEFDYINGVFEYANGLAVGDKIPDAAYGDFATDYQYQWGQYWYGGKHYASYLYAYTGAPLQAAGLQQLADDLAAEGPAGNSYRKYYSHHFLRKTGGERWKSWDDGMKDYLISTQEQDPEEHLYGSWSMGGRITSDCGRLWDTVSASLRLEIYYRHGAGF